MHAQWPYTDCLHAYSDLYTLYTSNPCVCVCVCSFYWNLRRSLCSESVTAERVLHRGVRQHHVGIAEHAQTVQAEGLDVQLVLQREASLWVETLGHHTERTTDVLRQTGVGVIWERETDDGGWVFPPVWKTLPLATATVSLPSSWVLTAILFKAIWHWQILKKSTLSQNKPEPEATQTHCQLV